MSQPTPTIFPCDIETNLQDLGVQPGWFVRYGCCSIWFEVLQVFQNSVVCVARDPAKGTELALVGEFYSAINEFCDGNQGHYRHWIDKDRRKSFRDKFFPESDKIVTQY